MCKITVSDLEKKYNDTGKVATAIVNLSPDDAALLLQYNHSNRNLNKNRVTAIARDIENGSWVFDGQPVRISNKGNPLDGQHRLSAVVKAGKSVKTIVIFGLPERSIVTMDTGKPRSLSDQLKILGEKNTVNLAAAIRASMAVDKYGHVHSGNLSNSSVQEYLSFLEDNPDIRELVRVGARIRNAVPGVESGAAAGLIFMFRAIDEEDCSFFVDELCRNDGSSVPVINLLKNAIIRERQKTKGSVSRKWISGIFIKAWNAYREGRDIKQLRFSPGGAAQEKMPTPI